LLEELAEKGFGPDQLAEMQKLIEAENSDLFDVLAYVAYALAPLTRQERANRAMARISEHFNSRQQVFLDFVLSHYVADLGEVARISRSFREFQRYLYLEAA
jgi:type I restriction enzyme R subunit